MKIDRSINYDFFASMENPDPKSFVFVDITQHENGDYEGEIIEYHFDRGTPDFIIKEMKRLCKWFSRDSHGLENSAYDFDAFYSHVNNYSSGQKKFSWKKFLRSTYYKLTHLLGIKYKKSIF